MAGNDPRNCRSRPQLEDIEPRILMSADHPLAAAIATDAQIVQPASHGPAAVDRPAVELVFIDHRVNERDSLLADLQSDAAGLGRRFEVMVLDAGDDAVTRITDALAGRQGVVAVHLVGHGENGRMLLGGGALDQETLLVRAADVAAWGSALTQDADLLLYGCDLAADAEGRALVADLAQLTGADVAASADRTGAAALGGNWTLEVATGAIEAQLAIGLRMQAQWQGVLATYTVTNTADSGAGSLRQAITSANANAGTDTINFTISGTGVHTITLASALPAITGTVVINGTTDDSFAANGNRPAIVIDGNGLNGSGLSLSSTADGSTIRGLVVRNFTGAAINIDSGSDGNTIAGNYLGALDATGGGATAVGSSYAVYVGGANNLIGGSSAADRNVVSPGYSAGGNYGILIFGANATGNSVRGNYLGTDAAGTTVLANIANMVSIQSGAAGNVIGGPGAGDGNVIATKATDAIYIGSPGAGNVVQNNRIGVSATGTWFNQHSYGITVTSGSVQILGNWIGGGTNSGIWLNNASGNTVQGNRIGTDQAGTANWGPQRYGIYIQAASSNLIGGTGVGQGNVVANANQRASAVDDGIAVGSGTGNALLGNAVYGTVAGSGSLGIDLGGDGPTANDLLDADTSANNQQNFPVLTLAATDGAGFLMLSGTLNSSASSHYRVELFASPSGATNNGEGRTYLGFVNVSTDAAGNASFSTTLSATVPVGAYLTATATRSDSGFSTFTDTSEFSARLASVAVLAVDTTADNLGGNTSSVSALLASKGPDGLISLREAITAINNTAAGAQPTLVRFNISGSGVHTITLASELPDISRPVVIDGTTDAASFVANGNRPAIVLQGNGSGGSWTGLRLASGSAGSTIRGLIVQGFNTGLVMEGSSTGNTIAGNYIGQLGSDGSLGGSATNLYGILVRSANNTIGGTSAADRNVISGHDGSNLTLDNAAATGNRIIGNYLGTNAAGVAGGGGGFSGVWITTGASNNRVGGTGIGEANLIAGHDARGVHVDTTAGAGNAILGNSIHSNGELGIDLGNVGVTANDTGDADTGANNLQNFPVLTEAYTTTGGQLVVRGTLNSTASSSFRIEFFGNTAADASGNGEGRTYLGFVNVTTDASGNASFNTTLVTAASSVLVSATATRANSGFTTFTDTSEFSANQAILEGRPRNTVPGPQSVPEDTAQAIAGLSLVSPGASTVSVTLSVTNGTLTVSLAGGATLTAGANGSGSLTFSGTLVQANAALATLSYQGGANYNGSATLTMLSSDGSSTDSDTVPITVTPVNDAPVLGTTPRSLGSISEDQSSPAGILVSTLLGSDDSDVDAGALRGVAVVGSTTGGGGAWQYNTGGGWLAMGSVSNSAALLLRSTDQVRFVPDGSNGGTAELSIRAWDQTSGSAGGTANTATNGGSTAFSSATATRSLTVTSANDAPVLAPIAPVLTGITEDQANPAGQTVASFLGASVSDVDAGAVQGIALTATSGANGQWQYSTNGGTNWTAVGTVDAANSLLLRASDLLRFVPDGSNGTTATITYRAWDTTAGSAGSKTSTASNGGSTAFSTALDTATLTVGSVNDAPVLSGSTTSLASVNENNADPAGTLVSTLLGSRLTDVDDGALQGIAITGATGSVGRWQYHTGGGWTDMGSVGAGTALLLRATDQVRFLPDDTNGGTATLTYHGWDRSTGGAGSKTDASTTGGTAAFSTATNTASVTILAVNDAPVLTPIAPSLTGITEDQTSPAGQTVASFLGGSITDVDSGAVQGIALHTASSTHGQWEYSLNGGANWSAVGTVDASNALLLRSSDLLRFVPNGQNGTTASIAYRAWDLSAGAAGDKAGTTSNGGSTAFSTASDTATLLVSSVNDAPTLTTASPTLNPLTEKQTGNNGQTVDSFTGAAIGDVDSGAVKGIALQATVNGNGSWQYSLDDGASWNAVGTVSGSSALLLRGTDRVRFVPDGVNGTTGSIGYRAWDQTSGAAGSKVNPGAGGGTTAFSTNANTASITVTNVNDAPVLAAATPVLNPLTEDDVANTGQTVASIVGATITDADPGALQGIAITGSTNGNGQWQYSVDGGSNWLALGSVSDASARLLRDTDRVRFVPDGLQGTSATLTYRAWDRSSGTFGNTANTTSNGGSTAFSSTANTASIAVSNINDAPAFSGLGPVSHTEGGAATVLAASATVTDPELAAGGSYAGATLTLQRNGGASAQDLYSATGLLGALSQGGNLVYNGVTVGTVTQNSAGTLLLTFNASATQARVNGVLQAIAYANGSDAPPASVQVNWSFSDGNGGAQGPGGALGASGSTTVTITATNDAPVLAPFSPTLPTLVADQTSTAGQTVASIVGGSITDPDGTGLAYGIAVYNTSSGNGTWQYNTGGGWTNVGAVSGASSLLLRSSDLVRFVPNGQDATTASFGFRAWDQTSGSAGSKVATTSNGGSSAFSTASDSASISVTAANYAPVLTPAAPTLTTIDEDALNNAGQTVASFLGSSVTDANGLGAQRGIAITSQSPGNGTWQYSLDGGTNWTALGTVDAAGSLLLRDTDRVRFVPNGATGTSATLSYRAWDQTSGAAGSKVSTATTGGLTAFSNASDTASLTVTEVNDAPVITPIHTVLPAITEDMVLQRQVFTQVGLDSISDVDGSALKGMAIIGLDPGNGTVEYSTDGTTWTLVSGVSASNALLLRPGDFLRFTGDGRNGTSGLLTYRAWDQSGGTPGGRGDTTTNGGSSAFSSATDTATLTVASVNDAPVLTPAAPSLVAITEDDLAHGGQTVASFLGASSADVDNGALQGIAVQGVTGPAGSTGRWQFDTGSGWTDVGAVDASNVLLLRGGDKLRFVPDGANGGTATLSYRAWDQTTGSAGTKVAPGAGGGATAFSTASDTASLVVTPINDAPVLAPASPVLTGINEDATNNAGQTVASFLGASVSDADTGALQGIAVTSLGSGNGQWQYSLDGGANWNSMGSPGTAAALLLRASDQVRFVPNVQNGTTASFSYRAWDQTSGSAGSTADTTPAGGSSAFSSASNTATITVASVNDAPFLVPGNSTLLAVGEDDASSPARTVTSLVAGFVTDVDSGAQQGMAIVAASSATGGWQYSTDGISWTAVGSVSTTSALLLRATDQLRFVPATQNSGNATLSYRAWDQSSGTVGDRVSTTSNGGTTAFSSNQRGITQPITAANDAPVLTPVAPASPVIDEDSAAPAGYSVAAFVGASITDADSGALSGIAVTSLAGANGQWQYSLDGSTWQAVGVVDATNALLLRSGDLLRFVPDGANGGTATLGYRAWDQTSGAAGNKVAVGAGGGTSAFSSAADTLTQTVVPVNDAPVLASATPALAGIDEDDVDNNGQTVASILAGSVSDVDTGALQGIAITATNDGNGRWQYSLDGSTWQDVGVVNSAQSLQLRSSDFVRFVPNTLDGTTASFSYRAWDRSSGTAGSKADSSSTGGTSAFSTQADTASIAVSDLNDFPPVITSNGGGATASIDVAENATAVTTVTATDADGPATVFSIAGGADAALFAIDSVTGALRFLVPRNFESPADQDGNNLYEVVVQASDGQLVDSQAITVRVTDVDEFDVGPVGDTNAAANSVAENASIGTAVGITARAVDADGSNNTVGYSLVNDAGGRFAINAVTGVVTVAGALDYESATSHLIRVRAQSSDGSASEADFTVSVTDVNDNAPVITSNGGPATADLSVAENSTAVTTVVASDPDTGTTLTYGISGGTDAAHFTIDATTGLLRFIAAPDFEVPTDDNGNNLYVVEVRVSDGTLSGTQFLRVFVTDVDEFDVGTPVDTDNTTNQVAEQPANGTQVGITAFAVDADGSNNTISYSLTDDAGGRFAIDATTGVVTVANGSLLDFETQDSHDITVLATSGDGSSASAVFTISVLDVNEAGVSAIADTDPVPAGVAENAANGASVGITALATDPDGGDTVTYSLADSAGGRFAIDAVTGVVTVADGTRLDYEAATAHSITVQATSSDGSSTQRVFNIPLADVNEFAIGTVTDFDGVANSVAENAANGTVVRITARAVDADGTTNTVSYSLVDNAGGRFAIDAVSGVVTVANGTLLDFEAATSHLIRVRATSADGSASEADFSIALVNLNDNPPVITSNGGGATAAVNVAENGTAVTTAVATDADGTAPTYSIVGGADAARFSIDANTGVLSFSVAPDFEAPLDADGNNSYLVMVRASDGSLSDTQDLTVTVTDVNEFAVGTPADSNASANSVAENAANGTQVGITAHAVDADGSNNTVSYSLTDSAGGRFAIHATTGVVTVADGTLLDYEAQTGHSITVQAASSDGSTSTAVFTITLVNQNDNPPIITSNGGGASASIDVAENTTAVTTVTATDLDGSALTFSISGGADAGRFSIDAATGALRFTSAPNFESPTDANADNVYQLTVRVSDGVQADTQVLAVTVTDVNEFAVSVPADTNAAADSVTENAANGTLVGIAVQAVDADGSNNSVSYSLTEDAGGRFAIDAVTGVVTVADGTLLDFEAATSHQITVRAQSIDGSSATRDITIAVTDVNDNAPVITSNGGGATASIDVAENGTAVTTVAATDADSPVLTYSIVGGADAARFVINASTGVLAFVSPADHEQPADADADNVYELTVQASDGSLADTQALRVRVTPLNDNTPVFASAASVSVVENSSVATTVAALDADLPAQTLTYNISGGADAARFTVDSTTGVLRFVTAPDHEAPADDDGNNLYRVQVTASDGVRIAVQNLSITVTDLDDTAPEITSNGGSDSVSLSMTENTTAVTTVTATDIDTPAAGLSYSIGGDDAARFAIDAATGVLRFAVGPNFESPQDADADGVYQVTVQVSDGARSDSQDLSINVTNVPEAPTGSPVVQGSAVQGQTLSADTSGIADPDGLGVFSYLWLRDGTPIAGANAAIYTLTQADVGFDIRVRVAWTDGGGNSEALVSAGVGPVANVNDAPTGLPLINGTPTEDQLLTVDTSAIADADGLGPFSLQWLRDGVAIGGATGTSYLLGDADVGRLISVRVDHVDGFGASESLISAATGPVANVNDLPTGLPVVNGTPTEDQTLSVDTSAIADADGLGAFGIQWLRDGVAIAGANAATYTLGDADVHCQISVGVQYTDGHGTVETLTSAPAGTVANVNDVPTGVPGVTGTPTEDQTLTADTSAIADADGLGTYSYQWLRDGVAIVGANAATHGLTDADVGARLSVRVDWVDGGGRAESLTSAQTASVGNVNDAPVLTAVFPVAPALTEDETSNAGRTVAAIVATTPVSDADAAALQGIAVIGTFEGHGRWQHSLDGSTWQDVGNVSDGNALLLRATDRLRFVPDGLNGTSASLSLRAWDQTSGSAGARVDASQNGGSSAFSSGVEVLAQSVTDLNDAPVLVPAAPALTDVQESAEPGSAFTVASLLGGSVSDVDGGALRGIAITAADTAIGHWQFSIDGGVIWSRVPALAGQGLLLRAADGLRFVSEGGVGGTTTLHYHAWDQTAGQPGTLATLAASGGTTAFSVAGDTVRLQVLDVNDPPQLHPSAPAQTLSIVEGALPAALGPWLDLHDPELDAIDNHAGATLRIEREGGGHPDDLFSALGTLAPLVQGDALVLGGVSMGTVTTMGGGVLELEFNAQATSARVQEVIHSIGYAHAGDDPPAQVRIAWLFSDGNTGAQGPGPALAASALTTVLITAVNDAPGVTTSAGTTVHTEGTAAVPVDPGLTLDDVDSATLASARVWVSAGHVPGEDVLAFSDLHGITGRWEAATGTLTLSGTATVAQYQEALRSVTYNSTAQDPAALPGEVSFLVHDGQADSVVATRAMQRVNVNDAPQLTSSGADVQAVEDGPPVPVASDLRVTDADSSTLAGAILRISAHHAPGEDVLAFTDQNGIGGAWNAATGTLALSGTATLAHYEAALRSVTYQNTSQDPGTLVRTVSLTVNDGQVDSAVATLSLRVQAVNDAPVITSDGGGASAAVGVDEGTSAVTTVAAVDPDGPALTYSVSGGADATRFVIDATTGALRFAAAPDHENPGDFDGDNRYEVQVQASDGLRATAQTLTVTVRDLDDTAPVIVSPAAVHVPENTTAVVTLVAVDPDSPTHSFNLQGGTDAGRFAVDATSGAMRFLVPPDYEAPSDAGADNTYEVVVAVTAGGVTTHQAMVIMVTDANEFAITPLTDTDAAPEDLDENAANGTVVGITAWADDPDGTDSVAYSLADDAGGRFAIDAGTGVVTVADGGRLDYETATTHTVTVRAISTDGSFSSQSFAITLRDVNEAVIAPAVDVDPAADMVAENPPDGSRVGLTIFARDPDAGASVTYDLVDDAGGRFAIDAVTGVVTVADGSLLDHEAATSHRIIVRATSSDASITETSFTIAVADVNEFAVGPVSDADAAPNTTPENTTPGAVVGITAQAVDADGSDNTVGYSLVDNAGGRFAIDAVTGVVTVADGSLLDFESATSHQITVRATSSDGSTAEGSFTITLGDMNEFGVGPVSDTNAAPNAVAENATTGALVGITAHAVDADGSNNTVGYSLVDNAGGRFSIDTVTGVVTVADGSLLDFEAASSHVITVRADSADGSFRATGFTIAVANVNEAPSGLPRITGSPVVQQVLEADTDGIADPDGVGPFTFQWLRDGIEITGATGRSHVLTTADLGGRISVRVGYVDGSGAGESLRSADTPQVADLNVPPVITSDGGGATAALEIGENASMVTTVAATDTNLPAQTLRFGIVGGADAALFHIDESTGRLRFLQTPDFERPGDRLGRNVYEVVVAVSDGIDSTRQTLQVAVRDLNDNAPVIMSQGGAATATVTAPATGGVVTTVWAEDADRSYAPPRYAIVGGADAARFEVLAATGELRLALPPETMAMARTVVLDVVVEATDGAFQATQRLAVRVEVPGAAAETLPEEPSPAGEPAGPTGGSGVQPPGGEVASGVEEIALQQVPALPDAGLMTTDGTSRAARSTEFAAPPLAVVVSAIETVPSGFRPVAPTMTVTTEWTLAPLQWSALEWMAVSLSAAGTAGEQAPLDRIEAEPVQRTDLDSTGVNLTLESVVGAAFTFSVALWLVRGGSLLTSLLVSSPMWVRYDLLPVLGRPRDPLATGRASDRRGADARNRDGSLRSAEERFFAALPPPPSP